MASQENGKVSDGKNEWDEAASPSQQSSDKGAFKTSEGDWRALLYVTGLP